MKTYNKILEAVNRGIQIALDDYQDIETNNSIFNYNDVIDNKNSLKQLIELNKILIDLGLPSGTKWCKYNLGVNINYKRKLYYAKNWIGNKYKWGETTPRNDNKWETYKFSKAGLAQLTKYCTDSNYGMMGFNDGIDQLLLEDDIATITLGKHFHIPTKEQFEELIKYTTNEWTTNYKGISNLVGRVFKSTINGAEIFFPETRFYSFFNGNSYQSYQLAAYYWTSNITTQRPYRSWKFNASEKYTLPEMSVESRSEPLLIRPVYN